MVGTIESLTGTGRVERVSRKGLALVLRYFQHLGAARRGPAPQAELVDFDAEFYYRYYSDLHHLRKPKALQRHYLEHGFHEKRFKNVAAARIHYRDSFGALPADFDLEKYKAFNEDLTTVFDHDWQYEFHYLEHGRREARPYKLDQGSALGRGRPWARLFRFSDFVACAHAWLEESPANRDAAIEIFVEQGVDRLAPIDLDHVFDPNFYRITYGFDDTLSDATLYRHWLETGLERGWYPNEEKALQPLVVDRRYPPAFDWAGYKAYLSPKDASDLTDRIKVLHYFFDHAFEKGVDRFISGPESGSLHVSIADFHLVRGHFARAIESYDRAIAAGYTNVGAVHRRGDAYAAVGKTVAAHTDFVRASKDENAGVWSHVHAAKTAAALHSFERAFEFLARAKPRWLKTIEYRNVVNEIIEQYFNSKGKAARSLYEIGDRHIADPHLLACLAEMSRRIAELEDLPPPAKPSPEGHIAILANLDLPQCRHYRVEQKQRQFARAGLEARVFAPSDTAGFTAALVGARAAIFYRVAAFPNVVRAILTARALGLATYYEIDDLIFDAAHYPDPFQSFEGQITREDYTGLLFGVPLFRFAMSLCDHGIASTEPLAREVEKIVRRRDCLVHINGLDERNEAAIAMGRQPRFERETVTIFYGSGTKAHNADFNEVVGPALLRILEEDARVRLVVVGHLRLRPEFETFASRIQTIDFVSDLDTYWSLLAAADINLSVLAKGLATDCKSEIKWLEAAVLQVPSVLSATATHRDRLRDGVDALLVDASPEFWYGALSQLIADPALRRKIGAAARQRALSRYALDVAADRLLDAFGPAPATHPLLIPPPAIVPGMRGGKLKILVCHVFFAPQSYGGATRVVQDNVDHLLDECPDIEVAVFTTDEGIGVPGRLRLDQYRGIPVYRLSTPREVNMDWRPFNPANVELFERVLDTERPDIVHFHCVQRLTGSVVERVLSRGIPYFVTVHDGWWVSDHQFFVDADDILHLPTTDAYAAVPPQGISLATSIMRRQNLARLLDGAENVLAVSDSFAEIYRRAGVQKVRVIENGVSPITPEPRKSRADGRLTLGHLGGRSAHKGAKLVEAVLRTTSFDHLALTMVDATLEPGTRNERIWGNTPVVLRGPCPQSEVGSLYASLDVVLAPSLWPESFGLVAREARAAGLWVVVSDRGAIAEGIIEGENGFVVDVSNGRGLIRVLRELDRDVARFKASPPGDPTPMRTSADQGRDIAEAYRAVAKRASSRLWSDNIASVTDKPRAPLVKSSGSSIDARRH
jgi:glycosyltransferase involved in cell wall biosynthesis/tetratricopeptide (TPR) repeat protein